jgi:hypothetical protein
MAAFWGQRFWLKLRPNHGKGARESMGTARSAPVPVSRGGEARGAHILRGNNSLARVHGVIQPGSGGNRIHGCDLSPLPNEYTVATLTIVGGRANLRVDHREETAAAGVPWWQHESIRPQNTTTEISHGGMTNNTCLHQLAVRHNNPRVRLKIRPKEYTRAFGD